jgi:hypothetical protein
LDSPLGPPSAPVAVYGAVRGLCRLEYKIFYSRLSDVDQFIQLLFFFAILTDKGIANRARYLFIPLRLVKLDPVIDIVEIRDDIVYGHCNLY